MSAKETTPSYREDLRARVARLSLEQKVSLLSGRDTWSTQEVVDAGIRSVRMSDGPHGLRFQEGAGDNLGFEPSLPATCFPPAVALGSTWDPALVERVGQALGRESRAFGVDVILGPGVNIKRSPLCGRNFEYLSEDPHVSGVLGEAYVRGVQAQGVGASLKHFAANNQETDRMRVDARVDERTLREIYLPAFERVVTRARPATVMCAYNRLNGVYGSENRWLLTDVLRGEWGFEGAVISDWGAVHDPAAAVRAGLDLEMPATRGRSARELLEAVAEGRLAEEEIDTAVARVLALGELSSSPSIPLDIDAQHAVAREAAAAGIVLLKNEGVLPLSGADSLAVIGEFARTPRFQGGGSSHVEPTRVDAFVDALPALQRAVWVFAAGFGVAGVSAEQAEAEAVAAARENSVTVIFAGLSESEESEGFDRTDIALPDEQVALIRAVSEVAAKTVVVLSHGGVVSVEGWHQDVDAIVDGSLLGQAGGAALADVLFGVVDPSGRLAESIPQRLEDAPVFLNFPGEAGVVEYGERVFVGYRAYVTTAAPVRYPFGYGLSYTRFDVRDLTVEATGDDSATVRVSVHNVGDRAGAHVVQVYVGARGRGPVDRPARELRAFAKVFLEAGASEELSFALDRRAFAYWDVPLGDWIVAPGAYRVEVGRDALTIDQSVEIDLGGDEVIRPLDLTSTVQEWYEHPRVGPVLIDRLKADMLRALADPATLRMLGSLPMQKIVNMLRDDIDHDALEELILLSKGQNDD